MKGHLCNISILEEEEERKRQCFGTKSFLMSIFSESVLITTNLTIEPISYELERASCFCDLSVYSLLCLCLASLRLPGLVQSSMTPWIRKKIMSFLAVELSEFQNWCMTTTTCFNNNSITVPHYKCIL